MKNIIVLLLLALPSACWIFACKNEKPVPVMDQHTLDSLRNDSLMRMVGPPPPPPPPDPKVEAIVNEQTNNSPFKGSGCCIEPEKRKKEACCCELVLEGYKKMKANNAPNLGKLKTSDPILADCRKKLKKAFDLVDNPPKLDKNGKESTEDLY